MSIGRGLAGVLAGLVLISLLTEGLEFLLVSLVNGRVVREPKAYFAVRNRWWFLAGKACYNTIFATVGGYAAAAVAGPHGFMYAISLAVLQTVFLIWGATRSEYSRFTPRWMWVFLTVATAPAIIAGAYLFEFAPIN